MDKSAKSPEEYLKQPYSRVLIPDVKSGTFAAEVLEFPGCTSQGDTPQEAYELLEEAAKSWIEAALDLGQEIPPPGLVHVYSGKFALRLPKSLHRQLAKAAERDGTSLNQFIVTALAEKMGATLLYEQLAQIFEKRFLATAGSRAFSIVRMESKIKGPSIRTEGSLPAITLPSASARDMQYA